MITYGGGGDWSPVVGVGDGAEAGAWRVRESAPVESPAAASSTKLSALLSLEPGEPLLSPTSKVEHDTRDFFVPVNVFQYLSL